MNIQEIRTNFKHFMVGKDIPLFVLIGVACAGSFLLGYTVSGTQEGEKLVDFAESSASLIQSHETESTGHIRMPEEVVIQKETNTLNDDSIEGGYVASKNGTKYHLPWCGGAKRIKEENKIWFKTKEDAEDAGYEPAGNCKGI